VKRKRPSLQLSEEQQLILGLLLVILVAGSLLYCLGFASLAVREAWENGPLPWTETEPPPEDLYSAPAAAILPPAASPTLPP